MNSPSLGEKQENPTSIHCFDNSAADDGTDTQAFITHHDTMATKCGDATQGAVTVLLGQPAPLAGGSSAQ